MMRTLVFFACILFPFLTYSQSDEDFWSMNEHQKVKTGIEKMADQTQSIRTAFKQKRYVSILSNAIESEGEMIFKKPQLLKWAYKKPYNYVILFGEKEIKINDEGKVSAFDISSSKAFVEINETIINSVSGNILQEEQFEITYFESSDLYLAKLRPKAEQMKSYIEVIEVYLDKADFTVSSIKLIEKGKDYTLIDFFDKKMNVAIPDEAFRIE